MEYWNAANSWTPWLSNGEVTLICLSLALAVKVALSSLEVDRLKKIIEHQNKKSGA